MIDFISFLSTQEKVIGGSVMLLLALIFFVLRDHEKRIKSLENKTMELSKKHDDDIYDLREKLEDKFDKLEDKIDQKLDKIYDYVNKINATVSEIKGNMGK